MSVVPDFGKLVMEYVCGTRQIQSTERCLLGQKYSQ